MEDDRYYRASGAVPFVGTVLMLLCGGAAAAALAFAYALLTAFNPFVYITFIGTFVFGMGMGGAVVFGAGAGNVRNHAFTIVVAACVGLIGLYLTWVFYIPYILGQGGIKGLPFVFDPEYVLNMVQALAEIGVWTMFNWTPKGWQLYAFWLVEAVIIVGAPIVMAASSRKPFCESCRRWTVEEKPGRPLALVDPDRLRTELEAERYEILDELRNQEAVRENSLRATLYTCPECADSNFLSISHVILTSDREGNVQTKTTELVRHLRIPEPLVHHLRTALVDAGPPLFTTAEPAEQADDHVTEDEQDEDVSAAAEPER